MPRAFSGRWPGRPSGVRFRPIGAADEPFLRELYASTRAKELAPVPWPQAQKSAFLAQQFIAQHTYYHEVYPDADYLLILLDDVPAGRIYVHRSAGRICLIDIALRPEYRGRGIGTALLLELVDEARAQSCPIDLHVEPGNPARRLYLRLGFCLVENQGVYDLLTWPVRASAGP